jgi:transposase
MLEETQDTEEIIERVAALDIDKAELVACVRVPNPDKPGLRAQEITTYSTMTRSLLGMCDRLRELEVTRVVMEATSDYWKPAFYLLEAQGLDPVAGQRPRRQAPAGPAQDKLDAVWLAKLAERSMVSRPRWCRPSRCATCVISPGPGSIWSRTAPGSSSGSKSCWRTP